MQAKFYHAWTAIRNRTTGSKSPLDVKHYQERGIKVCERWNEFAAFYRDMWDEFVIHYGMNGGDTEIDRRNNDRGYSPDNCRWLTHRENVLNQRPKTTEQHSKELTKNWITFDGKTMNLNQWADYLGVKRSTLCMRLYVYKMPLERVLTRGRLIRTNTSNRYV